MRVLVFACLILAAANVVVWWNLYQTMTHKFTPEVRVFQDSSVWPVNSAWI